MNEAIAAEMLARSATAYAACASDRLLEKIPDLKTKFGDIAFSHWKDFYSQRISELAVAMAEKEPALFVSSIRWSQAAFVAREVPPALLRDILVCLREALAEELPEACRRFSTDYITSALNSFEERQEQAAELDPADPNSKLAMQYLLQILEGNSQGAIKLIVDARENGLAIDTTYQALMTAQAEVGKMWHQGEINIAEEHVVTSTTERALAVLAYQHEKQPANGLTIVSAAVAGNTHEIGIRVLSDFFEFAGWRSVCLGADLPAPDIAQATNYFDSSVVLLSAALSTQLKAVRETIGAIRESNTKCKIMVGGTAFQEVPDIWHQFGADGFASRPEEAVLIATRLVKN